MNRYSNFLLSAVILCQAAAAPIVELPAKTTQYPDGRILFPVAEAARAADGAMTWNYRPTRWGMYHVEALFAEKAPATDMVVQIAGQTLGTFGQPAVSGGPFWVLPVSTTYFPESKPYEVRVTSKNLSHLRGLLLRPAPEGQPIVQSGESIALEARAATTHSVMLRFEPAEKKNCLGYWTNPSDRAEWKFTVTRPGLYEVELWQGCGTGQGGSGVAVRIELANAGNAPGHPRLVKETRFAVEETGHFQNFVPRNLGPVRFDEAGEYSLLVSPLNKKAAAVMDIRQILLKPLPDDAPVKNPALASALASQRVLFLGDSITYSGEYIEFLETHLRLLHPGVAVDFVNAGLPSETVSGLSEPGHAGGQFPRPDLHERLDRVLEKVRPGIIFACYGMNDGIYHPYSEERAGAFRLGLKRLREKAASAGALLIHLTPPVFDPVPIQERTLPAGRGEYPSPYEGYNRVLDRYAGWLVDQRHHGWEVIDIHTPMNQFLAAQRSTQPKFVLAGDGVHANAQGHWLIAREILRYLGAAEVLTAAPDAAALLASSPRAPEVHPLVQERQRLLKDAWLTHTGHQRPGLNRGQPLDDAQRGADEIAAKMNAL